MSCIRVTDTVIMGPPFLFTYPIHVSLIYTSWRVLSHYFQTLRGFSIISLHHAESVSSRRGDQTPCCIIPTCVVLCYVTCNWVIKSCSTCMGYCMFSYFHIKLGSFQGHILPPWSYVVILIV